MLIVAPLSKESEIEMLTANGAGEFYCGFVPPEWVNEHGWGEALSRRLTATANIRMWDSLKEVFDAAHARGVEVYLTLNAPSYREDVIVAIEQMATGVAEIGGDGFIVADPEMVIRLRKLGLTGNIHVSSVAAARNRESFRFFADMGVTRIILPRQVTVAEIRALRDIAPDIEIEAFVINDTCVFDEAVCFTSHAACSVGVLCRRPYEMDPVEAITGAPLDKSIEKLWRDHAADWGTYLGATGAGGFSPGHVPEGPCGLCAIPSLADAGVDAVKVVGREAGSLRKLRSVQSVRAILDLRREGLGESDIVRKAIEIRQTPDACAGGYFCYYRDVHRDKVMPVLDGGSS